ncbi:MAG: Ppx/GppA phosphatase family protein [Gemmatimonadales bacterium]|nr:Ppx/GppA phosphatase family protein [Gemmatimonadales bacterium]
MSAPLEAMPGAPAARQKERVAAIDVGSNSVRLLVAEYDPASGLEIIDEMRDTPRLARGVALTGRLDPEAVERAMGALRRARDVLRRRGVTRVSAVATAAMREAVNGHEFVQRVRDELDIPLRIIDAETEATLAWRSVAHHFPLAGQRTLVADIGGGSLELIGAVDGLVELTTSLPLGAVRLTELHLSGRKDTWGEIEQLRKVVRRQLKQGFAARKWRSALVIGSGGSFTSLARMAIARRGLLIPDSVHGEPVSTAEVEQLLEWVVTLSPEKRREVAGLNPDRADIILAGLAVTAELLQLVDARSMTVSGFGLREGLLLEMVGAAELRKADPLRLMREFVEKCQGDQRHVEHVRLLCRQLLEQLGPALGCEPDDAPLLEAAALLHDVGQVVSYRKHHKHSHQLILHADRLGLAARERTLVAVISRYHRRGGPSRKHAEFAALSDRDQQVVRRLAALLRLADGLDRGHVGLVERVSTELKPAVLTVTAHGRPGADLALECWSAERKSDVLADLLARDVVVLGR